MAQDWLWAHDQYKRARDKRHGKRLALSTRMVISRVSESQEPEKATFAVMFHSTEVVRYFPDGKVGVSLGGWNTVTTKKRIRDWSDFSVGSNGDYIERKTGRWGYRDLVISARGGSGWWVGDDSTWFYFKDHAPVDDNGRELPGISRLRKPKPLPKKRNTLLHPLPGDVFRAGAGYFICDGERKTRRCSRSDHSGSYLLPYYGDLDGFPGYAVVDFDNWRSLPSDLELLGSCGEGQGYQPAERFVWPGLPVIEEKPQTEVMGG